MKNPTKTSRGRKVHEATKLNKGRKQDINEEGKKDKMKGKGKEERTRSEG